MQQIVKTKQESLKDRAKQVLDLAEQAQINPDRLKKEFRKKVKAYHPDMNKSRDAEKYFRLIVESRNFLIGAEDSRLLEDDMLLEEFFGKAVEELGRSYEEWLFDKFYSKEGLIYA